MLEEGFDPVNGARPMARLIQDKLKVPIANLLLKSSKKKKQVFIDYSEKLKEFQISLQDDTQNIKSIYHWMGIVFSSSIQ